MQRVKHKKRKKRKIEFFRIFIPLHRIKFDLISSLLHKLILLTWFSCSFSKHLSFFLCASFISSFLSFSFFLYFILKTKKEKNEVFVHNAPETKLFLSFFSLRQNEREKRKIENFCRRHPQHR